MTLFFVLMSCNDSTLGLRDNFLLAGVIAASNGSFWWARAKGLCLHFDTIPKVFPHTLCFLGSNHNSITYTYNFCKWMVECHRTDIQKSPQILFFNFYVLNLVSMKLWSRESGCEVKTKWWCSQSRNESILNSLLIEWQPFTYWRHGSVMVNKGINQWTNLVGGPSLFCAEKVW